MSTPEALEQRIAALADSGFAGVVRLDVDGRTSVHDPVRRFTYSVIGNEIGGAWPVSRAVRGHLAGRVDRSG